MGACYGALLHYDMATTPLPFITNDMKHTIRTLSRQHPLIVGDAFFVALMHLDTRVAVVPLDLDGGGMMMMK